jgi:hypothetical protein
MPTNKNKQLKIKFDHNWHCRSTDDIDTNVMINTSSNDDPNWISLQLPHIIVKKELETNNTSNNNEQNWWYRKQFEWKTHHQNSDQRVYLIFEPLNDHDTGENNNDYPSIDIIRVWLNRIQIFSDSFQSSKISIDLTEQLVYKDDSDENNPKNTLIVCCTNASLSLHTYLLLPHDIAHAIEEENIDINMDKNRNTLPLRKNRVLDYLVGVDIDFNPKLKSPTSSKHQNPSDIIVNEDDEQIINNKENIEEFHVPRLAVVMLIVGSRGDVQPFVA